MTTNDKEQEDQCSGVVWEWSSVQQFSDRMRIPASLAFAALDFAGLSEVVADQESNSILTTRIILLPLSRLPMIFTS